MEEHMTKAWSSNKTIKRKIMMKRKINEKNGRRRNWEINEEEEENKEEIWVGVLVQETFRSEFMWILIFNYVLIFLILLKLIN